MNQGTARSGDDDSTRVGNNRRDTYAEHDRPAADGDKGSWIRFAFFRGGLRPHASQLWHSMQELLMPISRPPVAEGHVPVAHDLTNASRPELDRPRHENFQARQAVILDLAFRVERDRMACMRWFVGDPIAELGHATAHDLVREGADDQVIAFLIRLIRSESSPAAPGRVFRVTSGHECRQTIHNRHSRQADMDDT